MNPMPVLAALRPAFEHLQAPVPVGQSAALRRPVDARRAFASAARLSSRWDA